MNASPEFAARLAGYRSRTESVLDKCLALPDCGTDRLREAMRYSTLAGGKRLRPTLVYLTGHLPVRFTDAERRQLREFLERGGMLFIDDHNHDVDGVFHKTATEELTRTIGVPKPLPNTHPLYSAFFKFADGPPTTSHELNGWGDNLVHKNLFAVMREGRIAVLYSSKDYSSEWGYHPDNKRFQSVDNTKFAVNIVVYALTA